MNKKVNCITNGVKRAKNEGKTISLTFFKLYTAYIKN